MKDYITRLISEGEHQTLDFKYSVTDARKIARSLVAFANTNGGRLLIGVKDNGKIVGTSSDEEAYMIETASMLYSKPTVPFNTIIHSVNGKTVVEVIVNPSEDKPHYAPGKNGKWTAFIRIKDENRIANNVIVKVWQRQTGQTGVYLKYTDKEKRLLNFIENNKEVNFLKACRVLKTSKTKTESILANLIAIDVLKPIFNERGVTYIVNNEDDVI